MMDKRQEEKEQTQADKYREKKELRAEIIRKRNTLNEEVKAVWDETLYRKVWPVLEEEWRKSAKPFWVFLYMDIRGEAGTGMILEELWRNKIRTALPRVEGKELRFYPVSGREDLHPGYMGILEPSGNAAPAEEDNALVLVPGVAFDRKGFRLGYGGGFYDRFFARCPGCRKWGLAYEFQIIEEVPHEAWDQRMDRIFTPAQGTDSI